MTEDMDPMGWKWSPRPPGASLAPAPGPDLILWRAYREEGMQAIERARALNAADAASQKIAQALVEALRAFILATPHERDRPDANGFL